MSDRVLNVAALTSRLEGQDLRAQFWCCLVCVDSMLHIVPVDTSPCRRAMKLVERWAFGDDSVMDQLTLMSAVEAETDCDVVYEQASAWLVQDRLDLDFETRLDETPPVGSTARSGDGWSMYDQRLDGRTLLAMREDAIRDVIRAASFGPTQLWLLKEGRSAEASADRMIYSVVDTAAVWAVGQLEPGASFNDGGRVMRDAQNHCMARLLELVQAQLDPVRVTLEDVLAAPAPLQVAWDRVGDRADACVPSRVGTLSDALNRCRLLGLDWNLPLARAVAERCDDVEAVRQILRASGVDPVGEI